jgi:hypothetical protein
MMKALMMSAVKTESTGMMMVRVMACQILDLVLPGDVVSAGVIGDLGEVMASTSGVL